MPSKSSTPTTPLSAGSTQLWKPARYQTAAVKWLLQHANSALFADPGTRKTSMTLATFCALQKRGESNGALLIGPKYPIELTWPNEITKWQQFSHLRLSLVTGDEKKRRKALETDADIWAINEENVPWLFTPQVVRMLPRKAFDCLIIDELHHWRNSAGRRFKALRHYRPLFKRMHGLTGSPMPKDLLGLFGQMFMIDQGHSLGRYITHYRSKYFQSTGFGGYTYVPNDDAPAKIFKAVAPYTRVIAAGGNIDLPELVELNREITLPVKARVAYANMEGDLVAMIARREVTAATAAVASSKCRQIANGAVYDVLERPGRKPVRRTTEVHTAKLEGLLALLEELDGAPVLIGYEFQSDCERIVAELGKAKRPVRVFNGETTTAEARAIATDWNAGKIQNLLAHPQSVAHGLNLQEAGSHAAWFGVPWRWELYDQFNRRIRRSGAATKRLFVHRIVAANTIETAVMLPTLDARGEGQATMFAALQRYAKSIKRV